MSLIKNKQQFGRFVVVGGVNTILDFGLLFLFRLIGFPVVQANVLSTGVAFIFSFVANKKYTFNTRGTSIKNELFLFIVVTLFGLWILQSIVLWLVTPLLEVFVNNHQYALLGAKLLATLVSMTWNYLLYTSYVFRKS